MRRLAPLLVLLGALAVVCLGAAPAGATETEAAEAAAPIGPCTPYVSTSLVAAVCVVRSGEYSAAVTPSVLLPPNQTGAAVGGGVCEGGPWCANYYVGTDDVQVCYGYPFGPGAYICLP